jgi:hypothetical protein
MPYRLISIPRFRKVLCRDVPRVARTNVTADGGIENGFFGPQRRTGKARGTQTKFASLALRVDASSSHGLGVR